MEFQKYKILLVDDEIDILDFIRYNLEKEGYLVSTATNGSDALIEIAKNKPHLVLLDVMMPIMNGFEVCKTIRSVKSNQDILIAFLSARSEDYSQIEGFECGADDYIAKPIRPKVLISKVQALLRRAIVLEDNIKEMTLKDISINIENYTVYKGDAQIVLPRKEFQLLCLLASKPNKVFHREEIYASVWGSTIVGNRTIDVHIRRLREKLSLDNIKTIKGIGYKYEE